MRETRSSTAIKGGLSLWHASYLVFGKWLVCQAFCERIWETSFCRHCANAWRKIISRSSLITTDESIYLSTYLQVHDLCCHHRLSNKLFIYCCNHCFWCQAAGQQAPSSHGTVIASSTVFQSGWAGSCNEMNTLGVPQLKLGVLLVRPSSPGALWCVRTGSELLCLPMSIRLHAACATTSEVKKCPIMTSSSHMSINLRARPLTSSSWVARCWLNLCCDPPPPKLFQCICSCASGK